MQEAREELLAVFKQQFQKASTSRDAAATSRFFKLFPAIGWEAEGLQEYASFVVDLVKIRPPAGAKSEISSILIQRLMTGLIVSSVLSSILHYGFDRAL